MFTFLRDKAIEEAGQTLKLTHSERLENFDKILKIILNKAEGKISLENKK
jgi:hypothetical protein